MPTRPVILRPWLRISEPPSLQLGDVGRVQQPFAGTVLGTVLASGVVSELLVSALMRLVELLLAVLLGLCGVDWSVFVLGFTRG